MQPIETIMDLSNAQAKHRLIAAIRMMTGIWDIRIQPRRGTRTDAQIAFYWSSIVRPLAEHFRDQGESCTEDEIHGRLKAKFLSRTSVDPATGEAKGEEVPSLGHLTAAQMSAYLDRCIHFLAESVGIIVADPCGFARRAA